MEGLYDDDQKKAEGDGAAGRHELIAQIRQRQRSLDRLSDPQRNRIETTLGRILQHPPGEAPDITWRLLAKQESDEAGLEIPVNGCAAVPVVPRKAKELEIHHPEKRSRGIDKACIAVLRIRIHTVQAWNTEHLSKTIPL